MKKLYFASDYMEGAHEKILDRLYELNDVKSVGYGLDDYSECARGKIRAACAAPEADIFFLAGGTQSNAVVIDSILRPYQGVIAADTGHITTHEAGAIEYGGHKVLSVPHTNGKLTAGDVAACMDTYLNDDNHDHIVMPGMVYISQPTEYGTLYSLSELSTLSDICRKHSLPLYLDGARLAYALACKENDVTLPDIAHLTDAFYIGGTKCGTLFGEAVVFPKKDYVPHFFTMMKQHGALLAKGFVTGLQFDTLFTDDLYFKIGQNAIDTAETIRQALREKGYRFAFETPTNQIFIVLDKEKLAYLNERVVMGFWEKPDEDHTVMRIATSWATTAEDVNKLIALL